MGRIFGGREVLVRLSNHRFRFIQRKPFSSNANKPATTNSDIAAAAAADGDGSLSKYDAYRDLDKLDFMTAAKILFTNPPKQKKFGIDFHLVQLFFVCMPSLAVYLVAQYARYEMRRMEAELEVKKRAEEAKAKEMELKEAEEKQARSDPEILEVKERLGKLEEVVKEFVVESKKQSGSSAIAENQKGNNEKKQSLTAEPSNSASNDRHSKQRSNGRRVASSGQQDTSLSAVATDNSPKNHVGASRDEKK